MKSIMMRIIFLRWKAILRLAVFWILASVLMYASWGLGSGNSHTSRQQEALERVGKLLTSQDHPLEMDANIIEDDGDYQEIDPHAWVSKRNEHIKKNVRKRIVEKTISEGLSKNLSLEQKLHYQYISGKSLLFEKEEKDYGKHRSHQFCNPTESLLHGQEGNVSNGFRLINIHIIIRHGARSPIFSLPNHDKDALSCQFSHITQEDHLAAEFYAAMKNLTGKVMSSKHSLRMPFLPSQYKCDGAQLTGKGALQHLKLGQYLMYKYKDTLFHGGTNSVPFDDVYIRSTEYARTYQSAVAFLYGFFRTTDIINDSWEFSPYTSFCSTALSHLRCTCPLMQKLDTALNKEYHKRAENKTLHSTVKVEIGKILQTSASKVPFVSAILDVIMGSFCNGNHQLPCSKSGQCFTWGTVQRLWTYLDGSGQQEALSSTSIKYSRLDMHPLLHEIAKRFQNITHGLSSNKLVLYSGHDKTLSPLLNTLGISDGKHPPFAARLIIELYHGVFRGGYYMRVLYNGEDRTRFLRFCDIGDLVKGLCPLDRFLDFVYHRDMQFFGKNSYVDACAL